MIAPEAKLTLTRSMNCLWFAWLTPPNPGRAVENGGAARSIGDAQLSAAGGEVDVGGAAGEDGDEAVANLDEATAYDGVALDDDKPRSAREQRAAGILHGAVHKRDTAGERLTSAPAVMVPPLMTAVPPFTALRRPPDMVASSR